MLNRSNNNNNGIITRKYRYRDILNLSWGAQCWICQIFPGDRIEAPKAPMEMGGVSLGGSAPLQKIVFYLKMVNFAVFWRDKFNVFRQAKALKVHNGIGPFSLLFLWSANLGFLGVIAPSSLWLRLRYFAQKHTDRCENTTAFVINE